MNILEKSKRITLLLLMSFATTLAFAAETSEETVGTIDTPIYAQLGLSSTALFVIMTLFTLLLVAVLWSMASSTKNILKYKQELNQRRKNNGTKMLIAIAGIFFSSSALAANPTGVSTSLVPFPNSVFWAYIVVDLVLLSLIIYLAGIVKGSLSDVIVWRKMFRWTKFGKKLTNAVPLEEEGSILLDHDYDGITELDNQLPPWWKYGFYLTIVWAFVYFFYYQVFEIGNLQEAEYLAEMEEGERQIAEYKAAHPEMINADNVELLVDAGGISKGKGVYEMYCLSCHMEKGMGGVGPNLTDSYWLYGGDIGSVFTTISEGKPENGMAAWAALLTPDKIQAVASYVLQLEYIAPPTGKEPQGEEIE